MPATNAKSEILLIHMSNQVLLFFCGMLLATCALGQQAKIDSLRKIIKSEIKDTAKIIILEELGQAYREEKKIDSSIMALKLALELNEKTNYSEQRQCWQIAALQYLLYVTGNYAQSLKYASRNLLLSEKLNDTFQLGLTHLTFGHNYKALNEYRLSLDHYFKAKKILKLYWESRGRPEDNTFTILSVADLYLKMGLADSALIFTEQAYKLALNDPEIGAVRKKNSLVTNYILYSIRLFGDIYLSKKDEQTALYYYREHITGFLKFHENNRDLGFVLNNMARIFYEHGQLDSAIFFAKKALNNAQEYDDPENMFNAGILLSHCYDGKDDRASLNYMKLAMLAKDSMLDIEKLRQAQILTFNVQAREKEKASAVAEQSAKTRRIIIIVAFLVSIASFLIWNRIRQLRLRHKAILEQKESEKLKAKYEKEVLELEARALRSQMNPHFIFNCLNSIKALMQENNSAKGAEYLTTFSKLIRSLFNNADKKEVTLFDEIETCKFYLQLEAMRFDDKFSFSVQTDSVDLKSIYIPALIVQPFIENAIWHGIIPRGAGEVLLTVSKTNDDVQIIIDDNGIGREVSQQNKSTSAIIHQSKGVNLTQSRLKLDSLLQQRKASIETIDKKDENGKAAGTKVVITVAAEV